MQKTQLQMIDGQIARWQSELDQEWRLLQENVSGLENILAHIEEILLAKSGTKEECQLIMRCLYLTTMQIRLNQTELQRNDSVINGDL